MANVIEIDSDEILPKVGDIYIIDKSRFCILCSDVDKTRFFLVYLDTGKQWRIHNTIQRAITGGGDFLVEKYEGTLALS